MSPTYEKIFMKNENKLIFVFDFITDTHDTPPSIMTLFFKL